jgi:hypothetical protein
MTWKHNLIAQKELDDYLDKNLIYCEDTHSFVHRLFVKIKSNKKSTYKDAQFYAFKVLDEMIREYYQKKPVEKKKTKLFDRLKIPLPPKKIIKKAK